MYYETVRQYKSGIFLNPRTTKLDSILSEADYQTIQLLLGWQCKNLWKELSEKGGAGGSKAPPHFGRSGYPTQQNGDGGADYEHYIIT